MFHKSLMFICVCGIFLQITTADDANQNALAQSAKEIDNFISNVNKTFQEVMRATVKVVTDVGNFKESVDNYVQQQVGNTIGQINVNLATTVEQYGGVAGHIGHCLKINSKEISEFESKSIKTLGECVYGPVYEAMTIVPNLINSTQNLGNIVFTARDKIQTACPTPPKPEGIPMYALCVTNTILKLNTEAAETVQSISTNIMKATSIISLINNLPTDMAACVASKTVVIILGSVPLIGKIVECTMHVANSN